MNWGVLIGLIGIAVSVYLSLRNIAKWLVTKIDLFAINYAINKASRRQESPNLDDVNEGYRLARDLFGKG